MLLIQCASFNFIYVCWLHPPYAKWDMIVIMLIEKFFNWLVSEEVKWTFL